MAELFVEIGTEELPARFVGPAMAGLAAALGKLLGSIPHGPARTFGTPRRIACSIAGVAPARPVVEKLLMGPPASQDPAVFARARGADPDALEVVETPKGKVWGVRQKLGGERTADIVAAGLAEAILGIPFKKSMRWGTGTARFGRPIHTVCAVLGGERLAATVAGVVATNTSAGHWLLAPTPFHVTSAEGWLADLRTRHVVADVAERRAIILAELLAHGAGSEGDVDPVLLDKVVNLVEAPRVVAGRFSDDLLDLPPRLLVESMKKNQRYFPLYRDGALTSTFLVVTNNPFGDAVLIAGGNARVLAARFYDAKFFYAEDRKLTLAEHGKKLEGMTWIRGLGTMAERQRAVAEAAFGLAPLTGADSRQARHAGLLSKCDLTTQMVGEFPELQGHVGRLLAELEGQPRDVALSIEEHYLPRFAGDSLPTAAEGRALALAERITLLASTFAKGLAPKGSGDPLGLRRAAGGIVSLVLETRLRVQLVRLFEAAGETASAELSDFVLARLRAQLQEQHPTDLVDAVMATGDTDMAWIAERVRAMAALPRDEFAAIRVTFRRAAGLTKDHPSTTYDPALFVTDAEHALHRALVALPSAGSDIAAELSALSAMRPVLDRFFDGVLVMSGDAHQPERLGLLRAVTTRFSRLADFTRLSTE